MVQQEQIQPTNNPQGQRNGHKHRPWLRWVIVIITFILIAVGAIIWVANSNGPWISILPIIIFTALGVVISLFQWLFPVSSSAGSSEHHLLSYHTPQVSTAGTSLSPQAIPPIIVPFPTTQPLPSISPAQEKAAYRGIVGFPPPTDSRTIQQREKVVKEVYAQLLQSDITAIVLTGIGGVGKSTLAALIHRHAEEQRRLGSSPFTAEALWLRIDPAVTITDLVGTIFEALDKPQLDFGSLTPQNLAVALFNALNTTERSRLIVLDQFENLLDTQTGYVLTSRLWPQGTREYPPTYMQEYHSRGMEIAEDIELLRKQEVVATEAELRMAVEHCTGHAFALTLLASFLRRNRSLSLTTLFSNPTYAQLWTGNIARNLLDSIYNQQLNEVQRKLLLAFSIYREPVSLDAAKPLLDFSAEVPEAQTLPALDVLLRQHLLQASGEGRYQLHTIVADYAHSRFSGHHEQTNQQTLQDAHARAAQYYLQQAAQSCPPREQRRQRSDVHDLVEAVWQHSQAGQWQEAYNLMEQEELFADLNRWGGNAILLELYEPLLPVHRWHPQPTQAACIYSNLGAVYSALGQMERAHEYLERALNMCREQGDLRGEGWALNNLGRIYSILGQRERAREYFEQALQICREMDYCEQALSISREIGDHGEEATTLSHLGEVYSALGKKKQALDYYEQALQLYKEVGDRSGEGWTLNNLGKVYDGLWQKEEALAYFGQALSIRREVGDRLGEGRTLKNLGRVYFDLGQKERALASLGKTLNNLGQVYAGMGQKERALEYLGRALTIRREVGDHGGEATTLNDLGKLYADLGQQEQALKCYQQALKMRRDTDDREGEGTTLHNLGVFYFKQEKYDVALASFMLAKSIFEEVQGPERDETQGCIEELQKKIGDQAFGGLLPKVELQAQQVVEEALRRVS